MGGLLITTRGYPSKLTNSPRLRNLQTFVSINLRKLSTIFFALMRLLGSCARAWLEHQRVVSAIHRFHWHQLVASAIHQRGASAIQEGPLCPGPRGYESHLWPPCAPWAPRPGPVLNFASGTRDQEPGPGTRDRDQGPGTGMRRPSIFFSSGTPNRPMGLRRGTSSPQRGQ